MNEHETELDLVELIAALQAMPASERRAILAKLDKTDRAGLRRILRSLKSSRDHEPVAQLALVRLERADYSDGLKRHLRQLFEPGGKVKRPVAPATRDWVIRYLSAAAPVAGSSVDPGGDTGSGQDRPALKLAAVSGELRAAGGAS